MKIQALPGASHQVRAGRDADGCSERKWRVLYPGSRADSVKEATCPECFEDCVGVLQMGQAHQEGAGAAVGGQAGVGRLGRSRVVMPH